MCVKCGIRIQLSTMRQHMQDCGGGSVASTSSVYDPDMLDFSGTSQVTTIVNDDSSDEDKDPVPIKTGCQQKSAVSPTALADLQGIFPVKSSSALQSALDIGGSLEQAIDLRLETGSNAGDRDGSSTETGMPSVCTQPRTAVEIMQSYRCQTEQGTAYIDVNRMQLSMLRQIMTIYKNPQLNLKKHVNVNFYGEQGADLGGPSKEFFHSAISSLSKVDPVFNMQLFGGQDGHLIPFYGVDAVSSGCFQVAGKLVAHSLKNDGHGFVGLSPAVVKYLNTGSIEEAAVFVTMDDLTDLELKGLLQEKILQKKNIDEVDGEAKDKVEELLVRHGLTEAVPLSDLNKDKAMNDLLVAEVLVTRTVALDSFFHGLNSLGLGDLLRKHPSITEFVFPSIEEASVDMDILKSKLLQANPIQEIVGEAQAQSWVWFLEYVNNSSSDVDDNTGYPLSNSLVMFITGTTVLDPQENLEVTFQTDTTKKLLEADSCFRKLILPISHGCYEEFKAACNLSLLSGAVGYGRF
ncbi:G2/M phase-specific E3 ubiquitin-protein ligase-like [Montipora foliosa]|uniref:G2/M phase-specific E3 ubiquitin-protein ligase-like n=1 Tax=Montipora foliosa TaxID=591990 RepID=UPI0035F11E82